MCRNGLAERFPEHDLIVTVGPEIPDAGFQRVPIRLVKAARLCICRRTGRVDRKDALIATPQYGFKLRNKRVALPKAMPAIRNGMPNPKL